MIWGRGLRLYFMRSWQDFKPLDSILWLLLGFFRSYTQLFWQWHWLGTKLCGFGRNSICPFVHLSLLSPLPPRRPELGPGRPKPGPGRPKPGPGRPNPGTGRSKPGPGRPGPGRPEPGPGRPKPGLNGSSQALGGPIQARGGQSQAKGSQS